MAVPFLNNITLNKNEVQNFKIFNLGTNDPGDLTSGGDLGYFWLNTASPLTLKWWDGATIRSVLDTSSTISGGQISGNISGNAANVTGTVAVGNGGTGLTTYAVGDLLYASGTGTLSKLADVATGSALISGGVNTAPSWGKIGLTTHVSGTLPIANGGTGTTDGSITGTGALTFESGGSNNNLNLNPKGTGVVVVGGSGYLQANITGTADKAVELSSSRTLWGQSFNGTANVTGNLTSVGDITGTGAITVTAGGTNTSITLAPNGTGTVNLSGKRLSNLASPADGLDAVNRNYVDSVVQGLDAKSSCYVATTTGGDIILSNPGTISIDGVSYTNFTVDETRILVKDQSDPIENGIYIWHGTASAMTRSPDANTWAELVGAYVFIEKGGATGTTGNAYSGWICSIPPTGTLGTDNVTFVKFSQAGSYTPGRGITQSGTAFNFAQDGAYTAGQIPFPTGASSIGFSSNLFWDNGNSRLGIGTATPAQTLDVAGSTAAWNYYTLASASSIGDSSSNATIQLFGATGSGGTTKTIKLITNSSERLSIDSSGTFTWSNVGAVSTAMTLNATGLGIGVASPSYKLQVGDGTTDTRALFKSNNAFSIGVQNSSNQIGGWIGSNGNNVLTFAGNDGTIKATLDSSGNLGLGVTPKSWNTSIKAFDFGIGSLYSVTDTVFAHNAYVDTSGNWTYKTNAGASYFQQYAGGFKWYSVGASTGTISTWTQAMTLDASGNLGLGTAPGAMFHIKGTSPVAIFENTGNNAVYLQLKRPNQLYYIALDIGNNGGRDFTIYDGTASASRLTIDSSGNLGLGVTPSAINVGRGIEVGALGNGLWCNNSTYFQVVQNAYYNSGSATGWKYAAAASTQSGRYEIGGGSHVWYNSTAGTAGNDLTWSTRMTLDASGNLLVGTTGTTYDSAKIGTSHKFFNVESGSSVYSVATLAGNNASASNRIGYLTFVNTANSSSYKYSAWIGCDSAGSTANQLGANLIFATTGDGSSAGPVTRLTISSTGAATFSGTVTAKSEGTGTGIVGVKFTSRFDSATVVGNAYTFTHNLNSQEVIASIRRSTDNAVVVADIVMTTKDTITVTFASAITSTQYYLTVIG